MGTDGNARERHVGRKTFHCGWFEVAHTVASTMGPPSVGGGGDAGHLGRQWRGAGRFNGMKHNGNGMVLQHSPTSNLDQKSVTMEYAQHQDPKSATDTSRKTY